MLSSDSCVPEAAQHRPGRAVDRGAERGPPRAASTRPRSNGEYGGDVDGLAEVWPTLPRRARTCRVPSTSTTRSTGRSRSCSASPTRGRRRNGRAGCMLVDEFQDLTPAHLLLVRLLSAPGGAVFGVGDDDQTIYGYNGADPGWLIDFAALFPGAGDHPLEVNYRCPAGIVEVGRSVAAPQPAPGRARRSAARLPTEPGGWSVDTSDDPVAADRRRRRSAALGDGRVRRPTSRCSPGSTRRWRRCRWRSCAAGVPVAGGVGLEFADRTSVRAVLAWLRLATGRGVRSRPTTSPRRCAGRRGRCTRGSPSGSPSRATSPPCAGSRRGSTPSATPSGWRASPTTSSACRSSAAGGAPTADARRRPARRRSGWPAPCKRSTPRATA